jgi:hypothetical protein
MDFAQAAQERINPDLIRLAEHCHKLAAGGAMPRYADFRPADVSWILGKLYIMDVIDGGADYRFRLLGAALAGLHGCDHTGRLLSEVEYPGLKNALVPELETVRALRKPLYFRGRVVWQSGESFAAEKLLVPMSGADGELAVVLGAVHYEYPEEDWIVFKGYGVPQLEFDLQGAKPLG